MRTSQRLRHLASAGALCAWVTASLFHHLHDSAVPWSAAIAPTLLLVLAFLPWVLEDLHPDRTPGELRRSGTGLPDRRVAEYPRTELALIGGQVLVTAGYTVLRGSWALLPLLLLCLLIAALAVVRARRERRESEESPAEPRPTGPKLVGLRSAAEVPAGWAALVVHRPERGVRDAGADYRIHVDGDRVGTVGPGEALVVGLPPGEHRVRARLGHRTGAPVTVAAVADAAAHLTVEPGGPGGAPYAGHTPRPEEHILLTPGEPAPAPAPEPRSGR